MSSARGHRATIAGIAERCRRAGLDLVHGLSLAWLDEELVGRLAATRRDALAILVGNTKALWPIVRCAPRGRDPVDAWCEAAVTEAARDLGASVFYAHRRYGGQYLPLQRIAHQAGMLHLSPSHLSLHPTHGPWVALRALVVTDESGPPGPRPEAPDPCTPCEKPCLVAMEAALAGDRGDPEGWRRWLAIRDACPVGRASRYTDAQIAYHYTKDATWLDEGDDGDEGRSKP